MLAPLRASSAFRPSFAVAQTPLPCRACGAVLVEVDGRTLHALDAQRTADGVAYFRCRACGETQKLARVNALRVLRALEEARLLLDAHGRAAIDAILFPED